MSKITEKLREQAMGQQLGLRNLMNRAAAYIELLEAERVKLATIARGSDALLDEMCDRCCRYPDELNREDLDEVCLQCPVTKLAELIGV